MNLPSSFDWRDHVTLPPIEDQGPCGSCWAFATTGAVECAIKIRDGIDVDISEQWLVSCNVDGSSCDGGWLQFDHFVGVPDQCGQWGAVFETDSPYYASDLPCECPYQRSYALESWDYVETDPWQVASTEAMKAAIMNYGPTAVNVWSRDSFLGYTGGVFDAWESPGYTNHIVCLVGWDDNQGTEGVWILRNSWGEGWGEDGYMRIEYGCNLVGYAAAYVDYQAPYFPYLVQEDWSIDDAAGDNNGRPDPGEGEVALLLSVSNLAADAIGLTATASTIHPDIVFTQPTGSFGNVYRDGSGDNTASPVSFAVNSDFPATIVDFDIHYQANSGAYSWTETITMNVGQPQCFIVDDDGNDPAQYEKYYAKVFDTARTPYVVWDKYARGSPPADSMRECPLVIWFTGDSRSEVLSSDDITNLRNYLDVGGRLFLTGQDIAQDLSDDADSTFLRDYLHVSFVPDVPMIIADGVPGDTIGDGQQLAPGGSGGAANQNSPDILLPLDDIAKPCYTYYESSDVAGVHLVHNGYRLVYFGFGAEAIANGVTGFTKRDEVFDRVLTWLPGFCEDQDNDGYGDPGVPENECPDDNCPTVFNPGQQDTDGDGLGDACDACDCIGFCDVNGDGNMNPMDCIYIVNFVYRGFDARVPFPDCPMENGDWNCSGGVDPLDVVFFTNYIYRGQGSSPCNPCGL